MDTSDGGLPAPVALLDAALADLRAVGTAIERIDQQFRLDRARTDAAVNQARLAVDELRRDVSDLLQTMRNDVAATVVYIEQQLQEHAAAPSALAELAARVGHLEQAIGRDAR